jgi:Hypervirulence associated proteins TUDOR domain
MSKVFKVGDHVRWNSEAGRVSGGIIKKITSDTKFKGYTHYASKDAPNVSSKVTKRSLQQFTKPLRFGCSRRERESQWLNQKREKG